MTGFHVDRRGFLIGTAAIGAAMAAGPRFAYADGKVLKVRSYSDLQVLDPAHRLSAPEDDITNFVLQMLIRWKDSTKWEWQLGAAESIEQTDDTHINFKLRPGLMWSNGFGEVTAEDVKYSFERMIDPKVNSEYKDDWATLDHVEVTDKHSGVIVLKSYFAPLWTSTLPEGSAKIVCKAAVEKVGGKFTTEIPAACGPYTITQWVPKQKTVLGRNPAWTGPMPYYDEVQIFPIEDEKAAEIAYEAGDLDFTDVSLSTLVKYKSQMPPNSKIMERPSLAYIWVGMNVDHPNFGDIRVRKAIQQAINVDAVLQAAYFGEAERATGLIGPGMIGHRPANLTKFDPDAAKKLLKEAGKEGLKTQIQLLNKAENVSAAQVIQSNLADVGIELEVVPLDSGTFWTIGDQKSGNAWKDIQIMLNRFSMNPDPSFATEWFVPDQIGVWNWERWNSPEFGELNKKAVLEKDPAKRDQMYQHMQDLMEESGAYLFITHGANPIIYKDSIAPATQADGRAILDEFKPA